MAATFVKQGRRVLGRVKHLYQFTNCQSTLTSARKKRSNAAFLLGFGLAGLVGFSGILYGKKQRKKVRATSVERECDEKENCSPQSVSVSFQYKVLRCDKEQNTDAPIFIGEILLFFVVSSHCLLPVVHLVLWMSRQRDKIYNLILD